jgi:hypothetical protein
VLRLPVAAGAPIDRLKLVVEFEDAQPVLLTRVAVLP